ncbi:hypothetical protein RFI_36379, partial [Reticulomyxa filosa]
MSKSSNVDIVLFFWPDIDSFTDIKRGNSSSLFLRVLLEVCSTVCIKVSQSELDNFYVDKQTIQDKMEEGQSMGGGIQVGMKEQQKNDVSCNVEKMQSFPIEKEKKEDSSNGSVISKRAFVIEGAQSAILCHCSIQEHVTEFKPLQFTFSSKEELMNYIKQTAQTYRLKLWDEAFDTWGKALIFAESICPELIEEFNQQSRLIDEEHKTQISTVQSTAQEQWNVEMLGLEFEYGEIFAYKCKNRNLAELREIANGLSNEKINSFFSVGCSNSSAFPSKKDLDNGVMALTKFIPNNAKHHPFSDNNIFRELDGDVKKLYKWYEDDLRKVEESVRKQFEQEKREAEEKKEKEKEKEKKKNKNKNKNNNNDKNKDKEQVKKIEPTEMNNTKQTEKETVKNETKKQPKAEPSGNTSTSATSIKKKVNKAENAKAIEKKKEKTEDEKEEKEEVKAKPSTSDTSDTNDIKKKTKPVTEPKDKPKSANEPVNNGEDKPQTSNESLEKEQNKDKDKDKDEDKDKENEKNKEKKEVEQREEATKEKQGKIRNENNNLKSDDERGQTKNENKNNQQSIGDKDKDSHTESGSWWILKKLISLLSGDTQLTEEDKQVIKDRLACYDYTQLQIRCIAGLGKIYEQCKQMFINNNQIKSISFREGELKKDYNNNRSNRESELNKTFLKKLNERMNNDNSLSYDIKKCYNNELRGSIETKLKPIRHLTFSFGDFTTQDSRPDHVELKQAVQKKNEFDIRGNEELIFAYGLANNEMVLVLSIDRNVSDALTVEEKYSDDDKNASKQDVWSEQYNQNCITKIFLSSRQVLNKQKPKEELRGKITLAALSEQKHSMVLYERARQLIHVYKWNERITDSLQQLKNKTVRLCDQVLPDDFYVMSMCFDNKDDNLYISDNKNRIYCIELDTGLFNNEREIVCGKQYSKVMVTLEGGFIVGIKPQEQEGNVQTSSGTLGETPGKNNEPGSMKVDMKEKETQPLGSESNTTITTASTAIILPVKRVPTGLVECDFYVLDDSKELVRSLVLPKEFMSDGISDIQFKLILQKLIYIVSLDNQFILHCLPLQVSLKKSQLHVELTSMYGDLTTNSEEATQIKPSKLDYIEYKFYLQSKLTLHLSVLLNANESNSLSWVSKERLAQASELVLHAFNKVNRDTKKIFTHLDWQCVPIAIDSTKKQIYLKDVSKLVKNHSSSRSGDDFIRQVIVQFPMQIARASGGDFVLLHNGENDQARYARCTTNSSFVECIRFGGYDALINSWQGKIRV